MVILYFFGAVLGLLSRRVGASIPLALVLSVLPVGGLALELAFC